MAPRRYLGRSSRTGARVLRLFLFAVRGSEASSRPRGAVVARVNKYT